MDRTIDYAALDYSHLTRLQRLFHSLLSFLVKLLARVEISGLEHFPSSGPLLLATNHLHMFDPPLLFYCIPRRTVVFAADSWRRVPLAGLILARFGDAIWVARGQVDRRALSQALAVLRAGGVLGIAPEGTRSRSGGLGKAHTGAAYLATRAPAPILPAVTFGQEKAFAYWRRLRRVPVRICFGPPIHLPHGRLRTAQLEELTDLLMISLAHMLPPDYRGNYTDRLVDADTGGGQG